MRMVNLTLAIQEPTDSMRQGASPALRNSIPAILVTRFPLLSQNPFCTTEIQ